MRSAGEWSLGLENTETSIYNAYLSLIASANHLIYIENQFFISKTEGEEVENLICKTLADRIVRAIENEEEFLAVLVIPLLPGNTEDNLHQGFLTRCLLDWHLKTLSRGI